MSSIESAPAAIPATSDMTFAPAFAPAVPGTVSRSWARSPIPTDSARASAGTSPADTTRFGSSNAADIEEEA